MIDQKRIVKDLEACLQSLGRRAVSKEQVLKLHQLILDKNTLTQKVEKLRQEKNQKSKKVGEFLKNKDQESAEKIKSEVNKIKSDMEMAEKTLKNQEAEIKDLLLRLPNFPLPSTPDGTSSQDNVEILREGFDEDFFKSQKFMAHWDIMEELDIFDQQRASKISGSLFAVLKGSGAKLLRSLIAFAFDLFEEENYIEFVVPTLVNRASFIGTGQLPKFAEEAYHIEKDDLWAISTAEIPLTNLHREDILDAKTLPLKYMAYTPCFRREAGAAGQESRGLKRLHEFHKLELVKFCEPEHGEAELESLLKSTLKPIQLLKLPYRVLNLCTFDLNDPSAKTYDIEVYSPGTKSWLEVSSISLFTDYQSRRAQIRYKKDEQIAYAYTLNGSGLATPRVIAAILENYRIEKAKVKVPEVLIPYMKQNFL